MTEGAHATPADLKVEPLLQGTWALLRAYPLPLLAPLALLGLLVGSGDQGDPFDFDPKRPLFLLPFAVLGAAVAIAIFAVLIVATAYAWIMTTRMGVQALRAQETPDISRSMRETAPTFAAGFGTFLVWGLAALVGTLLLVLPGVFVVAVVLPWTAVFVLEQKDGVAAMQRAWDLTAGHRVDLFLAVLILFVVYLVANVLAILPVIGDALAGAVQGAILAALAVLGVLFYERRTVEVRPPPIAATPAVLEA